MFHSDATVAQRDVEQAYVFAVLLFVEGPFHQLQVAIDGVVQHFLFLVLAAVRCMYHLLVEVSAYIGHLFLLAT